MADDRQPILFFNRHSGRIEEEQVYGDTYLRWAYGTTLGKLTLWAIVRRAWFSHLYGWRMNRSKSRDRVRPFIEKYGLDPSDFLDPIDSYTSFNAFFTRKLKPEARPLDNTAPILFPADGRHTAYTDIDPGNIFTVKGEAIALSHFIGDASATNTLKSGIGILSRLCPVDYHRFHLPVAATLREIRPLKGPLDSVNPIATRLDPYILLRNQRVVCVFDSALVGRFYIIAIGAACVGTVKISAPLGIPLEAGAELGWFEFGGSSLFTLFPKTDIRLAADLLEANKNGMELYAQMGTLMAVSDTPHPAEENR